MRNVDFLGCVALSAVALIGLSGCAGEEVETAPTPEFPENSGQLASGGVAYPAGPYGINKGSIVPNYQFVGFGNPLASQSQMQLIQLADFYNPTGNEVFPENTPYAGKAGKAKPKALLVIISASWCVPCQNEAKDVLPTKYAKYSPMGGEFLLQLAEGPSGDTATPKNLSSWSNKFDVDYPATIDPGFKLSAIFEGFYPTNILINTQTMEIVSILSSSPNDVFWGKFEDVLTGEL